MSRQSIRLSLLIMGIVYQIAFWFHDRQLDLVMTAIYLVGSLTMKED
ncbi:hypothetical protein [uncultured Gemmiger sp.]|nr:hypothetical protein [uncultured Gemmiger sp.]